MKLTCFALAAAAYFSLLPSAYAVNLNAVYYASCKREVGVIIHVNDEKIAILSLDGVIKEISRFDIIYLAYYPIAEIPIEKVTNGNLTKGVVVKTLFKGNLVELVKGWPVDFSEDKISFLSFDGRETVIDRNSIWEIDLIDSPKVINFLSKPGLYEFVHPYPFSQCATPEKKGDVAHPIYPQQLLGDPLIIKRELDRLMSGHEKVLEYSKDQRFYPVPQVYSNKTSLGLWMNYGSRYGKSTKRTNDFVPMIVSELSQGPFGFQSLLVTGVAPLKFSIHEEPQTQFFYRLKADYIHCSFFYDIDRFLIGEKTYKWISNDLDKYDDRVVELNHISGGFDYGNYTAGVTLSDVHYGVRHLDSFFRDRMEMVTFDLSFQNRHLLSQFYLGSATDAKEGRGNGGPKRDDEPEEIQQAREKVAEKEALEPNFSGKFSYGRINLRLDYFAMKPMFSLIYRNLKFYREADQGGKGELSYKSAALTGTIYLNYLISEDLNLGGYVGLENHKSESGLNYYEKKISENYPKAGVNVSLIF